MDKIKPNYYACGDDKDFIDMFEMMFGVDKAVGAVLFNIMKYLKRYPDKNGLEDLGKAKEYLDRLYEIERSRGINGG